MHQVSPSYRVFKICNVVLFCLLIVVMVFPIYNVIVNSFTTLGEFSRRPLILWPSDPTLVNYRFLFLDNMILQAYAVTIFTTVVGTALSMAFTLMLAYGLSKRFVPGAHIIHRILLISMFIDAGLIPFYLMVRNLGLTNTLWSSIIPALISLWNYLVIRSFFIQLPIELEEAALIDGASWWKVFIRVVLPLSMPVIATFTLYYAVSYWNTWYNSMVFNTDVSLQTLQLYVYRFVVMSSMQHTEKSRTFEQMFGTSSLNIEGIKAAACTVAVLPMLCAYPFLQKYFVKGVMLGAIKG